jgi:RNA polymerase sigma factor (sigma-70 family)
MTDNENAPRDGRWGELLLRAAADDRAAFALLVAELKPYLLARLRSCASTRERLCIPDDAEDALHDALAIVWEKRATFNPRGHATAWLWIICRNCAVDILRRRWRHRTMSLHDRDGRLLDGLAIDTIEPPALVSAAEQRRRLRRAVARALWASEPRVRRAWHWRYGKGRPYAAIARRLGVPQGTVATWLHRFKQGVRGFLPDHGKKTPLSKKPHSCGPTPGTNLVESLPPGAQTHGPATVEPCP